MSHRRVVAGAILLTFVITLAAMAFGQNLSGGNSAMGNTVTGCMRTVDDKAVLNATVELRNSNGSTLATTYTGVNGAFEFNNVPDGAYEIVGTSGLSQVSEHIQARGLQPYVTLRVAQAAASPAGDEHTVSVAQMKIPGKARDALKKAREALERRELDKAMEHTNRALDLCADFAEALTVRALIKLDRDQVTEALTDLDRALHTDSGYGLAYLVMGSAFNGASRFDEAIRTLERGVSLMPRSWQGYFELGKAYLGKSDYRAALRQLDKAAALAPKEYAPLHLVRANAFIGMKDYTEAMTELESYLERSPKGPDSDTARRALDQVKAFVGSGGMQ